MSTQVRFLREWNGFAVGDLVYLDNATAAALIANYTASATLEGGQTFEQNSGLDSLNERQRYPFAAGKGAIPSGYWVAIPSMFRLRCTGSGSCVLDSRNSLGAEESGFFEFDVANATDEIVFPFPGSGATHIRATFPATMTVEVL